MKQNKKYSEDDLQNLLQNMPNVEDHQSADELYEKISSHVNAPESDKVPFYKKPWLVTSFSAAAVLIVLIASMTWLSNGTYDSAGDQADTAEFSNEESGSESEANTEANQDNGSSSDEANTFNKESNDQQDQSDTPESESHSGSSQNDASINSAPSTDENQSNGEQSQSNSSEGMEEGNIASNEETKKGPEENNANEAETASPDSNKDKMMGIGGNYQREQSYITFKRPHNQFATVGLVEENTHRVVPVTIIAPPNWGTTSEVYNAISMSVKAKEWGFQPYAFKDVTFTFNKEEKTVTANFPKDYELPEGKKEEQAFIQSLQEMFKPHNVSSVELKRNGKDGLTFTTLDLVQNITIPESSGKAYLLYQQDQKTQGFLAPVAIERKTIEKALETMKTGHSSEVFESVIPNSVEINRVSKDGETLTLRFSDNSDFGENPVAMIDGILMMAKSFGFQEVMFENAPKSVYLHGRYNMEEPIAVPDLLNPKPFSFPPGTAP